MAAAMHAVILAAGQGRRLRPLTIDRPKALLAVAGRPMAAHLLDALAANGVETATVVVGHGASRLQAFLGDGSNFGLKLDYAHQKSQLGPGHALAQCNPPGELVLCLPADSWYHPDLIGRLATAGRPAMIQVPDARSGRHGVPVVETEGVVDLLEAEDAGPRAAGFSGGAYCLPASVIAALPVHNHSLRDAVRASLASAPWALVQAQPDEYVDVIEAQDMLTVQDRLMRQTDAKNDGTVEDGAVIIGPVHVGAGTTIRAGTVVHGPAWIGEECDIGPTAVLMPGTSIRNHVRVEPFALLSRVSIASNVHVGSHCRVRNSIIDNGAEIEARCTLNGGKGTIIGADAQLGSAVTVEPDGIIGASARVAGGRTVTDVPDSGQAV